MICGICGALEPDRCPVSPGSRPVHCAARQQEDGRRSNIKRVVTGPGVDGLFDVIEQIRKMRGRLA